MSKLEPGDLIICKLDIGSYLKKLSDEYLTLSELRYKIVSGELCIILEIEEEDYLPEFRRIKILKTDGKVDWAFSRHFFKI